VICTGAALLSLRVPQRYPVMPTAIAVLLARKQRT
jgi:hypothetical protein